MKGQALINLIFFAVIASTVTTAAIIMVYVNSVSGAKLQEGMIAYQIAESGAENGLLRLLRDPSYTGETLTVGNGSAVILATGSGTVATPYFITSTGTKGNFVKKVEVQATYLNNLFSVISKKEIY